MTVREQGLGAQGRGAALPGNLSAPANFAAHWPEPGLENPCIFSLISSFISAPF